MADAMMFWFAQKLVEFLITAGVAVFLVLCYLGMYWWLTKK